MKKKDNPFNLPERFCVIVTLLNLLQDGYPPTKLTNVTVVCEGDSILFNSKGGKLWMQCNGRFEHIVGVMAGRFNIHIRDFIGLIALAYPKLNKTCKEFIEWLNEEEERTNISRTFLLLNENARELGYTLVKETK